MFQSCVSFCRGCLVCVLHTHPPWLIDQNSRSGQTIYLRIFLNLMQTDTNKALVQSLGNFYFSNCNSTPNLMR